MNEIKTIGIIGGGQLGRMLSSAAANMGYETLIYTPESNSPAGKVSPVIIGEYSDVDKLKQFAAQVDIITFEFENIPHESLELLEDISIVRPSAKILKNCRNRIREKDFINSLGISTAPYAKVESLEDLQKAVLEIGFPAILKTTELGYDGKGQEKLDSQSNLSEIWKNMQTTQAVLEGFIDFELEISVIAARNCDGEVNSYVAVENIHKNHILHKTIVPADIDVMVTQKAAEIAKIIATSLELIGIVAIEMFVCKDGEIIVNELAPRPHNSGHWTMNAAATSQFEQQIRAICNLPLGSSEYLRPCEMLNLIGDDVLTAHKYLQDPKAHLHLYGKKQVRAGRKMGHVNFIL